MRDCYARNLWRIAITTTLKYCSQQCIRILGQGPGNYVSRIGMYDGGARVTSEALRRAGCKSGRRVGAEYASSHMNRRCDLRRGSTVTLPRKATRECRRPVLRKTPSVRGELQESLRGGPVLSEPGARRAQDIVRYQIIEIEYGIEIAMNVGYHDWRVGPAPCATGRSVRVVRCGRSRPAIRCRFTSGPQVGVRSTRPSREPRARSGRGPRVAGARRAVRGRGRPARAHAEP
jgi:hypothetical protein